jgi:DNA ligase-1
MHAFAELYAALDRTTATLERVRAMRDYFSTQPAEDVAWAVYFLAGGKPRQIVPVRVLRTAAAQACELPQWLFEECYQSVGDLAETIALLLPSDASVDDDKGLASWMRERVLPLRELPVQAAVETVTSIWAHLDERQCFVFNKLITGALRVGVSRQLVLRALSQAFDVDSRLLAQRLIGYTDRHRLPDAAALCALVGPPAVSGTETGTNLASEGLPYPFFLAHTLDLPPEQLGDTNGWLVEWKWDGIRAQLVRDADQVCIWSRGEELVTTRFPEIADALTRLPAGVTLDGELVGWRDGSDTPLGFQALQTRIGRRQLSARTLAQTPIRFLAFDLLREEGIDLRGLPLGERRVRLGALLKPLEGPLRISPRLEAAHWEGFAHLRSRARTVGAEGLMLKRLASAYGLGRTRSDGEASWYKWKLDPYSVDAVLLYAQRGHGRRAGLYTDYTFAVWHEDADGQRRLLPFAKAYSGLTDAEIREVDAIIRRTTLDKFGPVRSVSPTLVFEIAFEGIQASGRHRAGLAVRFPRIARWRRDKTVDQADSLTTLRVLLR